MSISRRGFLKAVGASVIVVGAGTIGFVLTRSPQSALRPWDEAGEAMKDVRLQALSYAILAPNPHNRQPWLVKLVGEQTIDLHCQLDRRLPQTDPFDRQITIGLGCFVGLYQMAAARLGYRAEVESFPEGEPQPRLDERPIARVTLHKATMPQDALWEQITLRRSTKEPFDTTRSVSPATVRQMLSSARASLRNTARLGEAKVGSTLDQGRIERLRALTYGAFEKEARTSRTFQESLNVMRIGKAEIDANPDGIDIGGAFPEALHALGLLTRESMADPKSQAFEQTLGMYREVMSSAMGYVWLTTPGNSRRQQLQVGNDWLRLNLAASQMGLSFHPVSQALQEYAEVASYFKQVNEELGVTTPSRLQMLGRIGYGPVVSPSPRWPLQTRILQPESA